MSTFGRLTGPMKFVACIALCTVLSGCGGGGGVTTAAPAKVAVACVGDSITGGTEQDNAYPTTLSQLLGSNHEVQNFGVGGATLLNSGTSAYQAQAAFRQALKFKPSIVVVALGTNDRQYTFDAQTKANFAQDYKSLIAAFRQSNPTVKVYTCLPTPSYPLQGKLNTTLVTDIIPLVRQVAQDTNSQVIDLNTPLGARTGLFLDGVHPNEEGARLIATTVYGAIAGQAAPQTP